MNQVRDWQANPYRAATVAKWGTASKWAGRAGTVTSFATSAFGQWNKDSADPTSPRRQSDGERSTSSPTLIVPDDQQPEHRPGPGMQRPGGTRPEVVVEQPARGGDAHDLELDAADRDAGARASSGSCRRRW